MTSKQLLLLGLSLLAACKSHSSGVTLKGQPGNETTRTVNYQSLYDVGTNELKITSIISFESSYRTKRGSSAANDEGTAAAYKLLAWLQGSEGQALFQGKPTVDKNDKGVNDFLSDRAQTAIGSTYKWVGHWRDVNLSASDFPPKMNPQAPDMPAKVNVQVRIVLGSALVPNDTSLPADEVDPADACAARPESSVFGDTNYLMPAEFCNELAHSLVEDDIVSYNGHIWAAEGEMPTVAGEPAEVNATTLNLRDRMQQLRSGGINRKKQAVVFINACHAERIEEKLMEGMIDQGTPEVQYPLLLSQANYSNFGYFAEHDAVLMIDTFAGKPLAKIMLDLTTTLRPESLKAIDGAPLGNETEDEAKALLGAYVSRPDVTKDPKSGKKVDPNNVLVVAYKIKDGRVDDAARVAN